MQIAYKLAESDENLQSLRISTLENDDPVPAEELYEVTSKKTIGSVYQMLDPWQKDRLNRRGYGFLNKQQMEYCRISKISQKSFKFFATFQFLSWVKL